VGRLLAITVARKPLSEGSVARNVLKHGTGALDIDGSRIGTFTNTTPSGMDRFNAANATQGYRPNTYQKGAPDPPDKAGRWPANLILEHHEGCRRLGTKRVKGITGTAAGKMAGNPEGVAYGQRTNEGISRWRGHPDAGKRVGFVGDDGLETVDAWECVEGCPVAELDEHSGVSSGHRPNREVGAKTQQGPVHFGGIDALGATYPDSGGASRFFHHVQVQREE